MKKKSVNLLMVIQWAIFLPMLLPVSILTGAMEGIKKVFEQANEDIFREQNDSIVLWALCVERLVKEIKVLGLDFFRI